MVTKDEILIGRTSCSVKKVLFTCALDTCFNCCLTFISGKMPVYKFIVISIVFRLGLQLKEQSHTSQHAVKNPLTRLGF